MTSFFDQDQVYRYPYGLLNFLRQAVQKDPFSIPELVHIRFLMHFLLFMQLTLTGNQSWINYNL